MKCGHEHICQFSCRKMAAVGFEPTPRRDWCLKPAPWTARPRYLLIPDLISHFELICNFGRNAEKKLNIR